MQSRPGGCCRISVVSAQIFISVTGLENVVELIFSRLKMQILSSNAIMTGFLRADIPLIGVMISLELTPEHLGLTD